MDTSDTIRNPFIRASYRTLGAACAGLLVLTGCATQGGSNSAEPRQVSTVSALEKDLAKKLEKEFGPANIRCGATDWFAGGMATGELQAGDALGCFYMDAFDKKHKKSDFPLMVDLTVLLTSPDSYSYSTHRTTKKNRWTKPTPEWMFLDGLTCEQLSKPGTIETVPKGLTAPDMPADQPTSGPLSYPQVVYYWYDMDQPEAMDPDGDGRPCTDQYPESEVAAVFDQTEPLPKVSSNAPAMADPLTTYQIRKSLEPELLGDDSSQVDCDLAGPVGVGSIFTCAPRINGPAQHRMIAVLNADGEFLMSDPPSQNGSPPASLAGAYRPGLSCSQIAAPLTADTIRPGLEMSKLPKDIANDGMTYRDAVLYVYINQAQADADIDDAGWPCTDTYTEDQVSAVQDTVRTIG